MLNIYVFRHRVPNHESLKDDTMKLNIKKVSKTAYHYNGDKIKCYKGNVL